MFADGTAKEHELEMGLRAVAVFEAIKGALVILAGLGVLALIHRDVQALAESVIDFLHLNPERHYPHIFIEAAGRLTDARLRFLALAAFGYSTVRFAEAYGLWHKRAWAEWFAIISGSLYLPFEVYELLRHPTMFKASVLLINAAVVGYMIYLRHYATQHPEAHLWERKSDLSSAHSR
jgi:uncharacterized membrane protein (DUF2068 family)